MTAPFYGIRYDTVTGHVLRAYKRTDGHMTTDMFEGETNGVFPMDYFLEDARAYKIDLVAVAEGTLVLMPRAEDIPFDRLRGRARARLDHIVEKQRLPFVTRGDGQAQDYQEKQREAEQFQADPAPDTATYPMLAAEVGFHGTQTLAEMAALVLLKAQETRAALAAINGAKYAAIEALEAATTEADIEAVFEAISWPEQPA